MPWYSAICVEIVQNTSLISLLVFVYLLLSLIETDNISPFSDLELHLCTLSSSTFSASTLPFSLSVCVCVCVCLFVYIHWLERLLLTEQNNKCKARVEVSDDILSKDFCIKDLCLFIKDNHRRSLQDGNCKRISIKLDDAMKSKRQLL